MIPSLVPPPPPPAGRPPASNALMGANMLAAPAAGPVVNRLAPPSPGSPSGPSGNAPGGSTGTAAPAPPPGPPPGSLPPQQPPQPPVPPMAAASPAHPADDLPGLASTITSAALPPAKMAQMVQAADHVVQAAGTLLSAKGPIAQSDVDAAIKRAADGGHVDQSVADQFAAALPPASDQDALRAALETQQARSLRTVIAFHVAAQAQGVDLKSAGAAP